MTTLGMLIAVSGCATWGNSTPYQPLGELPAGKASFDATSVRGSRVQWSRRKDGSWAGEILGRRVEADIFDHRVCVADRKGVCMDWEEVPQGLLVTVADVDRFLFIPCEESQTDCGYTSRFLNAQQEVDRLCPQLGCKRVGYWRPHVKERGPEIVVPLLLALYADGW